MSFGSGSFGSAPFGALGDGAIQVTVAESVSVSDRPEGAAFMLLRETLVASEWIINTVSPGIRERLSLAEQLSSVGDLVADIINGAYLQDEPLLAWMLLATEGIQLADAPSSTIHSLSVVADILVATGATETRLDAQAALTAALAVDDLVAAGWDASVSDVAQLVEALNDRLEAAAALVEAALLADAASSALRIVSLVSDEIAANDEATAIGAFGAMVNDGATLFASIRLGGGEYSAWVVNTETNAPSEYRNFAFNSMVEFDGRYYGATDDGIYELDVGDDDEGDDIPAWIRTGLSNLGNGKMKRLPAMYLGYKSDGTLVLKVVTTGERGTKREDWYQLTAQTAGDMREGRIKLGKGLKSVYWAFEIHNKSGSDFELDNVTLYPLVLDRRI